MKKERVEFRTTKQEKARLISLANNSGMNLSEFILYTMREAIVIEKNEVRRLKEYSRYIKELIREDCTEEVEESTKREYREFMEEYLPRVIRAVEEEKSMYTQERLTKATEIYEKDLFRLREFRNVVNTNGNTMYELYYSNNKSSYGYSTNTDAIIEVISYIKGKGLKYL